ncbi:gas vesicle protein GvpG [Mycobacterium sp.]|jgi:hypothetical protein|uniref:gas vesicle protein GvpG n=1 Tax=Mycobacterium sp. TaxID=1785 RepID=UPI002D6744F7|nr:gas vesicle protein GvpG [Mycobacterium sp.]HZA09835.1 gas vesicle protein GvpG [Mycobacterium sp.]
MGIFSAIVLWPLAPVRGVISLAEVIQRQAEQQLNDPATTRRRLEELQEARERGEISPEEEKKAQQAILQAKMANPLAPKR